MSYCCAAVVRVIEITFRSTGWVFESCRDDFCFCTSYFLQYTTYEYSCVLVVFFVVFPLGSSLRSRCIRCFYVLSLLFFFPWLFCSMYVYVPAQSENIFIYIIHVYTLILYWTWACCLSYIPLPLLLVLNLHVRV